MNEKPVSLGIQINHKNTPDFRGYIRPVIDEFVTVLEKNFSKITVAWFYQNVASLKLIKKKKLPSNVAGVFDSRKNEIICGEEEDFTIFHELFHMTSCHGGNVGFHDYHAKSGWGINEGYTEFLTRKYFGFEENDESYLVEVSIATVLNTIIGEEKMKELYMNADLEDFIFSLEKYLDEEEVCDFIHKMDRYTRFTNTFPFLLKIPLVDQFVSSLVEDLSRYLAKMYKKKSMEDSTFNRNLFNTYKSLIYQYIPVHHQSGT